MLLVLDSDLFYYDRPGANFGLAGFILFSMGFMSSVLSASLGMARLLMTGPSKLVKKQGHLGGYAQVGFALIMFSIMFVLVAKALWMALVTSWSPLFALVWIGVSLAPQLILVSLLKID